jgi:hypothetical protein
VQAHTEANPQNSQNPRTLDCIYLCFDDNDQGGHQLLDLRTGWMIKRHAATLVPITKTIIDLVHEMATNDKIQMVLKLKKTAEQFSMILLELQEWTMIMTAKTLKTIALIVIDEMDPNEIEEFITRKCGK